MWCGNRLKTMSVPISFILLLSAVSQIHSVCVDPPVVEHSLNNASLPGPYPAGTIVEVVCDKGYAQVGNTNFSCNGTHFVGQLTCKICTCPRIDTPNNCMIVNEPSYESGCVIIYDSNPGYVKVGQGTLHCSDDNRWSPDHPPVCEPKDCGDYGNITNGQTSKVVDLNGVKNTYGSVLRIDCDEGYVLHGQKYVRCQEDGTWESRSTCKPVKCPPFPGLYSSCVKTAKMFLNYYYMNCRNDVSVTKFGGNKVQCQANGEWSSEYFGCYCDCKVDDVIHMTVLNLNTQGYVQHGQILNWTCKDGYMKNTTDVIKCSDGNMATPICQQVSPAYKYKFALVGIVITCIVIAIVPVSTIYLYLQYRKNINQNTSTSNTGEEESRNCLFRNTERKYPLIHTETKRLLANTEPSCSLIHTVPSCSLIHSEPSSSIIHSEPSCSLILSEPICSLIHTESSSSLTNTVSSCALIHSEPSNSLIHTESSCSSINSKPSSSLLHTEPSSSLTNAEPASLHTNTEPSSSLTNTEPSSSHKNTEPSSSLTNTEPSCSVINSKPSSSLLHTEPSSSLKNTEPSCSLIHTEPSCSLIHTEPSSSLIHTVSSSSLIHSGPSSALTNTEPNSSQIHTEPSSSLIHSDPNSSLIHTEPSSSLIHSEPNCTLIHTELNSSPTITETEDQMKHVTGQVGKSDETTCSLTNTSTKNEKQTNVSKSIKLFTDRDRVAQSDKTTCSLMNKHTKEQTTVPRLVKHFTDKEKGNNVT